jgi:hypothetical protein
MNPTRFRLIAAALCGIVSAVPAAFAQDLFADPELHAVGDGPMGVQAGDLDDDPLLDVVVANHGSGDLSIVWDPAGPNPTETRIPIGGQPRRVATGDLNGDGREDIAVGLEGSPTPVVLLFNRGHGAFDPPAPLGSSGVFPDALWVGDLDGDADRDLVLASAPSDQVVVFLNDGAGGFTETAYPTDTAPSYPSDLAVGDADDDGDPDLLVTASLSPQPPVLLRNLGSGAFAPYVTFTGIIVDFVSAAVGDLAADGSADLILLNFGNSTLAVFRHQGAGTYGGPTSFPIGATTQPGGLVRLGDLDLDGRLDAAVGLALQNPAIPVLIGDGTGGFSAPALVPAGAGGINGITLADLDADGDLDLAATASGQDILITLDNLSAGSAGLPSPSAAAGFFLARPAPNPGRTPAIAFNLPRSARVRLTVYDAAGRTVARLLDGDQPAGRHEVEWPGTLAGAAAAPAGVYYLRLVAGGQSTVQKLVLTR